MRRQAARRRAWSPAAAARRAELDTPANVLPRALCHCTLRPISVATQPRLIAGQQRAIQHAITSATAAAGLPPAALPTRNGQLGVKLAQRRDQAVRRLAEVQGAGQRHVVFLRRNSKVQQTAMSGVLQASRGAAQACEPTHREPSRLRQQLACTGGGGASAMPSGLRSVGARRCVTRM